jgi:hypothetical protein
MGISRPTVITQPGSYVVARNISCISDASISLGADPMHRHGRL